MRDLLLRNATVITMDAARRVLADTSVAIRDGRIAAIGPSAELDKSFPNATCIDCNRKALLPGLVDLHGYLGGSIVKSLGETLDGKARRNFMEEVVAHLIDEEWWAVDTRLAALERLKCGTTFMFSMLGGNGTRTDDPVFARISARELARLGLRSRIGLGPGRPPWPQSYSRWEGDRRIDYDVAFDTVIDHCNTLFSEQKANPSSLVDYWAALSRIGNRNEHDPVWSPDKEQWVFRQAEAMRHLMAKHKVGFFTHMYGNSIEYAHDEKLGLLGPNSILSHCIDISDRALDIMAETGSCAAHHPRAARIYSFPGRCPIPEMIDRGIVVGLGSDIPANHDCDLFQDMKEAVMQQRIHFRDPFLIPPGKALEMATIDGYRALGLDHELGSVETGKKADLITIDLHRPHLAPIDMIIHRLVYQASGHDVNDVIVDGRMIMRDRKIMTIDESEVLDDAEIMYRRVFERGKLAAYASVPKGFWGASRT